MKILFIAPYIYAPEFPEHSKNKSGFGMMVYDIARAVSNCGNKVVIVTNAFGPTRQCKGFSVVKNSAFNAIFYGKYKGIFRYLSRLKAAGQSFKEIIKGLYYYLNIGYIKHVINKEKPDIVHIHGCSTVISETIVACREQGVPFVVTLHGLLEEDAGAGNYLKQCERDLIKNHIVNGTPITVISTKMKDRFLSEYYQAEYNEDVVVITNGINVGRQEKNRNIRKALCIGEDKKIILSVGSVCGLKNQVQTIRAFSQLTDKEKDGAVLVFVGTVHPSYKIAEEIERLKLQGKVFFSGFVSRDELKNYYSAAALTVTASITEGFGLSMIEGFLYGVPCVAFSDLDAIGDIYNECAMLLCEERSDEALANAIRNALTVQWDKDQIIEHCKKFSLEAMTEKYNAVYKRLIKNTEK